MTKLIQSGSVWRFVCASALILVTSGTVSCKRITQDPVVRAASLPSDGVTEINISGEVIQTGVKRFGINLGGQNYYDSGQMIRDFISNNPGFEGGTWQTIIRCQGVSDSTCSDGNQWNQWPRDFLKGATFQVLSGPAAGTTGTVLASTTANPNEKDAGVELSFARMARPIELDDFILVRKDMPGDPTAGWGTNAWGGGTFSAEYKDLSPKTSGKQALRISAIRPEQGAGISAYWDSLKDHSFVQMHGHYRLEFLAKGTSGSRKMKVTVERQTKDIGEKFFEKEIELSPTWQNYSFDFTANDAPGATGTGALTFFLTGSEALLDDVSLTPVDRAADNPTIFRDEVVNALRQLKPGILRYQDGGELGSSIDNLIAPTYARKRAGWSGGKQQDAIPTGLVEFLELCKTVGAEPWFTMPGAMSPTEAHNLIEFLSGPANTPYGAKRAARGQREPWTTVFPKIHLELGNEMWNGTTFAGEAIPDAHIFGLRAKDVFLSARATPSYDASKFDLVIGSFSILPDWTKTELASSAGYDSTSVGGYLYSSLNDTTSDEAIFAPMFAEPEMMDSRPNGLMAKQLAVARGAAHPANLTIYEENTGTSKGSASQEEVDSTVPSVGAGVALLDHMLLMVRDLGIKDQSVWALTGFQNSFDNSDTHAQESTPLYGTVVDLGGATNRKRPQFLAESLVNSAILSSMVKTNIRGADPVWNQAKSTNGDGIELQDAHEIQTFAFSEGNRHSLVVVNLSRTSARPMRFSGINSPKGKVEARILTADKITATNEKADLVKIKPTAFEPGKPWQSPPFSLTVFTWTTE